MKALGTEKISIDQIRKAVYYKDGELYWNYTKPRAFSKHSKAGGKKIRNDGYRSIRIDGTALLVHRVVFALHKGYFPYMVDHINQDRSDNRIENLRPATHGQNNRNRRHETSTGWTGVTKNREKYCARLYTNDVTIQTKNTSCLLDAATIVNFLAYNYLPNEDLKFFQFNCGGQTWAELPQ